MVQLQPKITTDAWVTATWEEFLQLADDPRYAKAKGYYFNRQMRVETVGTGPDHAGDNTLIILALGIICGLMGIPVKGLTNCSYRKPEVREVQPDVSYYVGDRASLAPQGSSVVNLDEVTAPDLAIEIADSSINDDLGKKRLLYEDMQIAEYWVVDVENTQLLAFQIIQGGSIRITQSQVIPGLEISLLDEVLQQGQIMNDSQVIAWLMQKFKPLN